ncbi:MAG: 3-dehydroquinate synthase [Endomicrobia bacterium]|nr:3-dehydroquinate synthase [Endomicrobiia bacterium]MDW8055237.1 3-dehydroquinate synthase [Elusimicrobiota bacterium]
MKSTTVTISENKKITIYFDKIEKLNEILTSENVKYTKFLIVTHKNLWNLYSYKFRNISCSVLFLPEGERIKSIKYLEIVYQKFLKHRIDRKSIIGIFGGGVLGDLVGFACSTYMRGINYIQIPTSLLAMVDSSIGGKTGINLEYGKNLVGSFYQPRIILCDVSLLESLPKKEFDNALGEVLKYTLINSKIYDLLVEYKKSLKKIDKISVLQQPRLISECIKTKLEIVKKDEKESLGIREKLNLGHTIAHAIEAATKYKVYTHGEAVVLGLIGESYLSYKLKYFSDENFEKFIELVNLYTKEMSFNKMLTSIPERYIFKYIKFDKKVYQKNYRFALPVKIGDVRIIENVPEKIIIDSLRYTKSWLQQN